MVEEDHDEASKEEERSRENENESSNHISYEASTGGAFSLEIKVELCFWADSDSLQKKNLAPPPGSTPPASHVDAVVILPVRTGHDPGRSFCSREELAHCSRFQELEQGHKSGSAAPKLELC